MKWQSLARYHFIFFKAMVRACSGVSTLSHIILFCSCSPLETERKQLLEKEKKYFYPSFLVTCRNSGRVLTDHFNFYLSIYIFFFLQVYNFNFISGSKWELVEALETAHIFVYPWKESLTVILTSYFIFCPILSDFSSLNASFCLAYPK